ncbi:MAG: sortase [Actinomycetota bacterium]
MSRSRRVPFFDRPRPPRDWRWVVGNLGRMFITLGLLMFAFVGYQLWGTGIKTAQAQDSLEQEFIKLLERASTSTTTAVPDTTVPGEIVTSTTIPTAPAIPIELGAPVAQLRIERIGLDWTVVEGVRVADLQRGPGHFPETPLPGQYGNAAIAGHRTTYGAPFGDLDRVVVGDLIEVGTLAGNYTYRVTGSLVVSPGAYGAVIPTLDFNRATLTLSTCTPKYSTRQRLIVQSELVPEMSATAARPAILGPATPPVTTLPPGPVTGSTIVGETIPPTTTAIAAPTTTVPTGVDSGGTTGEEFFQQGWFSDRAAIPHAIAWGVALLLVVIASWLIGKRARRLWVCFLVGVVPFVAALYFFYENVNRLLPPSL